MAGTTTGRAELAAILDLAARQDGPIRLIQSKEPDPGESALFPSSKGRHAEFQKELVGPLLEEVVKRPRMVKLTAKGIEILVRNTPQDSRAELMKRASPLYLPSLMSVWRRIAIPREKAMLEASIEEHFGEWFPGAEPDKTSEIDDFKLHLARELAASWSEADSSETRKRLSYFLRMVGAIPFEEIDQVVTFSGLTHKPKAPLFKGDSALVLNTGWKLELPAQPPVILLKAEVTTIA